MGPGDQAHRPHPGVARVPAIVLAQSNGTTIVEGSYVLTCRLGAGQFESCVSQARRSGLEMIGESFACSIGERSPDLRLQLKTAVAKVMMMEEADGLVDGWISALSLTASGVAGEMLRELLVESHPGVPMLDQAVGAAAMAVGANGPLTRSASAPALSPAEPIPVCWDVNAVHVAFSPDTPPPLAPHVHRHALVGVAAATALGLAAIAALPGGVDEQPIGRHDRAPPEPLAGWMADEPAPDRGSSSGALVALDALLAFGDLEDAWNQSVLDATEDLHEACGGSWTLAKVALSRPFAAHMGTTKLTNEVRSFESPVAAQTSLHEVERNVAGCEHVMRAYAQRQEMTTIVQIPASRQPQLGEASFAVAATTSGKHPMLTVYGLVRSGRFLTSIDLSVPAARTVGSGRPVVSEAHLRRFDQLMNKAARQLERAVEPAD